MDHEGDPVFQRLCLPADAWYDALLSLESHCTRTARVRHEPHTPEVDYMMERFSRQMLRKQVLTRYDASLIAATFALMLLPVPLALAHVLAPLAPY